MKRLLGLLVLLLVAAVAWVGVRGFLAYGHARDAAAGLQKMRAAIEAGDIATARSDLGYVQDDTRAAARLTSDPVWQAFGAFPFGGQNFAAVTTAAQASNQVTLQGIPALLDAAAGLAQFGDGLQAGEVDPGALQSTVDGVTRADASLAAARQQVEAIDRTYLLPPVERGVDELEASLDLATQLRESVAGRLPTG